MRRLFNKGLACSAGLCLCLVLLLPSCATTELYSKPPVHYFPSTDMPLTAVSDSDDPGLRVMTLNVAHGRGDSFHQLLQHSGETMSNLDDISLLLKQTAPDVIALQEIDGPSFWSGNFDHLEYLAGDNVFTHAVHAPHVDAIGLAYGTALMSRFDLGNPQAVTFDPSLSPVPKGFVVSTINWPGRDDIAIDIVSVHLDFISRSVRRQQADELIAILRARSNRMIVMGDLNAGWQQQDSVARYLAEQLNLTAYQPENRSLVTFPALGERLDWILISPGFGFSSYDVIGAGLSDHRGVVAELVLLQY